MFPLTKSSRYRGRFYNGWIFISPFNYLIVLRGVLLCVYRCMWGLKKRAHAPSRYRSNKRTWNDFVPLFYGGRKSLIQLERCIKTSIILLSRNKNVIIKLFLLMFNFGIHCVSNMQFLLPRQGP